MRRTAAAAFIVLVYLCFSGYPTIAQPQSARVLVASPIFLRPDTSRTPLVTAPQGMQLKVLALEGDWCRVQFSDRLGERTGYIEAKFIEYLQGATETASQPGLSGASTEPWRRTGACSTRARRPTPLGTR